MADRRAVVTQDAIYTDNGIKLVEKGARIDSRLYDRLVQHKLREPIDRHLTVENAVDVPALIAAGQDLAEQGVLPQMLAQALGSAVKLLAPLRSMPLPEPIAFKLTVMREQRPDLFEHSLQMMMVAVFLGLKSGLSERDCIPLAAAALLHDAGVLHMDPAWMDPLNKVTGVQRKHLVAHPITSMLMHQGCRRLSPIGGDCRARAPRAHGWQRLSARLAWGGNFAHGAHPAAGRGGDGLLRKIHRHARPAVVSGAAPEPPQVPGRTGGPCAAPAAGRRGARFRPDAPGRRRAGANRYPGGRL